MSAAIDIAIAAQLSRESRLKQSAGITGAAKRLGVTREHLSRVVHGHRQSRRLMRRFVILQKESEIKALNSLA